MRTLSFIVGHYAAIGVIALLCYLFGRRVTQGMSYRSKLEEIIFSFAIGSGVISYLVFLLGLLGLLYPLALVIALATCCVVCYPLWAKWARQLWSGRQKLTRLRLRSIAPTAVAVSIIVAMALPFAILPLYPPTAFDATMYHLPYAKTYAQNHQLAFTPFLRYAVFPQNNEMLFTLALILYDDTLAQLIQFLFLAGTVMTLIAFGERHFTQRAGWWSAAILLGSPLVVWLSSVAYVDIGVTFYLCAGAYAFLNWRQERSRGWLWMAGCLCGLAIGVKYVALIFTAILGLVAIFDGVKKRRPQWPLVFGLIAFSVAAPWFARNYYYTGNPVFPILHRPLGKLLGAPQWSDEYTQNLFEDLPNNWRQKNLKSFALLPYDLTFRPQLYRNPLPLSAVLLFTLPLLIVFMAVRPRFGGVLALATAYLISWFLLGRDTRFLTPALPLFSLAAGVSLDRLLGHLPVSLKWLNGRAVAILVVAILSYQGWRFALDTVRELRKPPSTSERRKAFLTHALPTYSAYHFLNERKGREYTLYGVHEEKMAYFADGRFIGNVFGPGRYDSLQLNAMFDGGPREARRELYRELKSLGVDHLLVPTHMIKAELTDDKILSGNFKLIYARASLLLFELSPSELRAIVGPNLLRNPGFEQSNGDEPEGWAGKGHIRKDSPDESHEGSKSVKCETGQSILQAVPVKAGELYRFSFYTRSLRSERKISARIIWTAANGENLSSDDIMPQTGPEWRRIGMIATAPNQAVMATTVVTSVSQEAIWIDNFSFSGLSAAEESRSDQ